MEMDLGEHPHQDTRKGYPYHGRYGLAGSFVYGRGTLVGALLALLFVPPGLL